MRAPRARLRHPRSLRGRRGRQAATAIACAETTALDVARRDLSGRTVPVQVVATQTELNAVAKALSGSARIAIDTESNSMHAYREKVCWIQIRSAEGVHLVDTVALRDLEPLRREIASGPAVKLLHGADYDVVCMKRDFGFGPAPLFDTMLAAQILGYEQLGLGALVERICGVHLDKAYQRYDWGSRPLDPAVQPYLVDDVRYLPELHDALMEDLMERDLLQEVSIEFRRVEALEWSGLGKTDPDAWMRVKGARELSQQGRSILRALHRLREGLAESMDRPPFKVFGNHHLLALSDTPPRNAHDLLTKSLLPPTIARRHGQAIQAAIEEGVRTAGDQPREFRMRRAEDPNKPLVDQALEDALKEWRRQKVQSTGLTPLAILPNHALNELASKSFGGEEELEAVQGLRTDRRQSFLPELWKLLRRKR